MHKNGKKKQKNRTAKQKNFGNYKLNDKKRHKNDAL